MDIKPEDVTQKFYTRLAEFMIKHNYKLLVMMKNFIFNSCISGKEYQLVYIDDFFKILREWGFAYSQREKDDFTQVMSVNVHLHAELNVRIIEKVLEKLGIDSGMPVSNKFLNFENLDLKSFRIVNRIHNFLTINEITDIMELIKPYIKVIEIISNGTPFDVEYINAQDLNNMLREKKLVNDVELHEPLMFLL